MEAKFTNFEITCETKEKLDKAITEVMKICQMYKLPAYVSVAISNNEKGTEYLNQVCSATSNHINLKNDKIRKHMLVANDYEVVPPREVISFDVGDFN